MPAIKKVSQKSNIWAEVWMAVPMFFNHNQQSQKNEDLGNQLSLQLRSRRGDSMHAIEAVSPESSVTATRFIRINSLAVAMAIVISLIAMSTPHPVAAQSSATQYEFYQWHYGTTPKSGFHIAVSPVIEVKNFANTGNGLAFGRWTVKNHPDINPQDDPDSPRFENWDHAGLGDFHSQGNFPRRARQSPPVENGSTSLTVFPVKKPKTLSGRRQQLRVWAHQAVRTARIHQRKGTP
jgi:hypothetical protein